MMLEHNNEMDTNNNSAIALVNSTGGRKLQRIDTHDGTKNTMIYMEQRRFTPIGLREKHLSGLNQSDIFKRHSQEVSPNMVN